MMRFSARDLSLLLHRTYHWSTPAANRRVWSKSCISAGSLPGGRVYIKSNVSTVHWLWTRRQDTRSKMKRAKLLLFFPLIAPFPEISAIRPIPAPTVFHSSLTTFCLGLNGLCSGCPFVSSSYSTKGCELWRFGGGKVKIVQDRIAKIVKFPAPRNASKVKSFLGTVSMTRRWVPNFAEIARPLSRLTGKVEWRWGDCEKSHFYVHASRVAAGLAITQFQEFIEVPIIYDSLPLNRGQWRYPTYKREIYMLSAWRRRSPGARTQSYEARSIG